MKTIALLAVLFAGNAFAAPGFEQADLDRDLAKAQAYADRMQSAPLNHLWEAAKADPSAYQSSKVDYTIVALPDGKTASALTFK
jgi:predicted dehydrogenase